LNDLYELAINHRELMISKVLLHWKQDTCEVNCVESNKLGASVIGHICDIIIDSLRIQSEGDDNGFGQFSIFQEGQPRTLLADIGSVEIIQMVKYFKGCMNEIIFQLSGDKDILYARMESSAIFFDKLELEILSQLNCDEKNADSLREELIRQAIESKKLLNEAIEHDRIRTEFFSNLSHELRTPLNVILGTLQLVDMFSSNSTDPSTEKTKKYYKIMRQNIYRLLRLINNLIDLNKLDAGYMKLNKENHDIVGIIAKIAASVSDYIEEKGIHFNYSSSVEKKIIACDPDKIERIILNLLSNAIKFTDRGGEIQVRIWGNDDRLFISVKDNGIGIPKEKQGLVFERFAQIDKSLVRNHQGSGIGLSLVKSLVELHDGKISLISEKGKGCDFIIELPVVELFIMESPGKGIDYNGNNRIEVINIEFSDIYS